MPELTNNLGDYPGKSFSKQQVIQNAYSIKLKNIRSSVQAECCEQLVDNCVEKSFSCIFFDQKRGEMRISDVDDLSTDVVDDCG